MILVVLSICSSCDNREKKDIYRLLYWNIQNGMWDGQEDNYDRFVEWVKRQNPDICVWCEAQSIYENGTDELMDVDSRYLVDNWGELANRYGHNYCYISAHRDNYPQVITSKYPINNVLKMEGNGSDSIVSHGSGWAQIEIEEQIINLVTLHTWPHAYAFQAKDQEASKNEHGGDKYRRMEMEYICNHTINSVSDAENQYWIMLGDFNSRSRVDNFYYHYPENDSRFLVHDYINNNTPYIDIISKKYPQVFKPTNGRNDARIDYIYCTNKMFEKIIRSDVISDNYTNPVRNPQKISNFWHPSDHRPIFMEFCLNK